MPTRSIERIAEGAGWLTPEVNRQLAATSGGTGAGGVLDRGVDELAARAVDLDEAGVPAMLGRVLSDLGQGLEADHVTYYAADPEDLSTLVAQAGDALRFEAMKSWSAAGSTLIAEATPDTLELSDRGELERDLWAGRACGHAGRVPGAEHPVRWLSASTSLRIPCAAGGGLFGVFVVSAGLSASRWNMSRVARAESLARSLAGGLDRLRMAKEIERLRLERGHVGRLETLGRVASAVAHDFNNVLTAISGYADLLELELESAGVGGEGSAVAGDLDEIRVAADRGARLVEQVLAFGRPRKTGVEAIDLEANLRELEGMLRQVLGKAIALDLDLALDCDLGDDVEDDPAAALDPTASPPAPFRVVLDPGGLAPVLMNLASNARGALDGREEGGRFSLSTRCTRIGADGREGDLRSDAPCPIPRLAPGRYVRLTARDNGCGIEPALIDRVCEPFFTTKNPGAGTGLGLASLAEFVRESKGGLRIESAPGEGAAFHLYFPIAEACRIDGLETSPKGARAPRPTT